MAKAKQASTNRTVQGPPEQLLMLPAEAAAFLRISLGQLYQLTSKKQVPFMKLGAQLRFDRELLAAWVAEQTTGGEAQTVPERRKGARATANRNPRRAEGQNRPEGPIGFRFNTPKRTRGR